MMCGGPDAIPDKVKYFPDQSALSDDGDQAHLLVAHKV